MRKFYFLFLTFVFTYHASFSQTDPSVSSGLAKQKEGKHDQAITDLTDAIKKNEPQVLDFLKKWDEYSKFTEFERAEKGMEAPPIEAGFSRAYYLRAVSLIALKRNEEAMNDLNTAIKINPKVGAPFYERGKLLWTAGNKYEGCCDFGMARSLGDSLAKDMFDEKFCWNEAVAYYKEATSKMKLNQYDAALELIQKAIKLCPDSASYYVMRGKCYTGIGKLDMAFPDFDKAITAMPENAEAYFGRGVAFYAKRKFQEAFNDLDKAVQLNANFADAYLYRAYSCEGMNKIQSALYDYQQVQRLRPRDPLAFFKSALLKNDNGDPKGACADFNKAASLGHTEAADYLKTCK